MRTGLAIAGVALVVVVVFAAFFGLGRLAAQDAPEAPPPDAVDHLSALEAYLDANGAVSILDVVDAQDEQYQAKWKAEPDVAKQRIRQALAVQWDGLTTDLFEKAFEGDETLSEWEAEALEDFVALHRIIAGLLE